MANKRRPLPAAVREQLERKHRQTATLAERQGAALGKTARQQLKPLTQAKVDKAAAALESFTIKFAVDARAAQAALRQMAQGITVSGMWAHGGPVSGLFRATTIPMPPAVDGTKLEALKSFEPYRVVRPAEPPLIPDMVTCITAWRAWEVVGEGRGLRLQSLGKDHIWKPRRVMEAECDKRRDMFGRRGAPAHDAPDWDCTCGVWSFKELSGLVSAVGRYSNIRVLGTVSLWGEVIETENGYRAQYAYPSELWLFDETLEELGYIYAVPVRLVRLVKVD